MHSFPILPLKKKNMSCFPNNQEAAHSLFNGISSKTSSYFPPGSIFMKDACLQLPPFVATWIELETLILSEVNQKEKGKYHMISLIWNLKYGTDDPI